MIDLHTHSNLSDGSLSPEALAALCDEADLSAVALTDHDTMAGCKRFLQACVNRGIQGIAGVEISAEFNPGTMHVLGYFATLPAVEFMQILERIRQGREERNERILATLASLDMVVDAVHVAALAGNGVVGRPHIAQAMVAQGYARDFRDAFDRWLGKGKPAYHDRYRLAPVDAVSAIRRAGGVAVLAHPFTLRQASRALAATLDMLVDAGLNGVEVFYPEHAPRLRDTYITLAKERGLALTGGSDFHGELNPAIQIGRGFGNIYVQEHVLQDLSLQSGVQLVASVND